MRDKLTLIEKVQLLKRYGLISEGKDSICGDIECRNCNYRNYEYPDCQLAQVIAILNNVGYDIVRKDC